MAKTSIDKLKERLMNLAHFGSALALLHWDQQVHMPPKGSDRRASTISHISALAHEKFISIDDDGILTLLRKSIGTRKLSPIEEVIVKETARNFDRAIKLPKPFVRELAEVTSKANNIWVESRKKSDFKMFLPSLKKIIELKRKEAKLVGYKNSPYDALLDTYEPGLTTKEAEVILNDLKDFLVPFVKRIAHSKTRIKDNPLKGNFPIEKQREFNEFISEKMGFDIQSGVIETSVHPFTTSFHPEDVRFTTRYREDDVMYAVRSTMHEAGHALYEQGLPKEHFGLPPGEYISLGIHESQSRFWENIIGKSAPFWKYFYPKLQNVFPKPFKEIAFEDFYKAINIVKPSPIRTEADEVTYNLHIIVRFEIEKEMIEGSINPKDIPQVWNAKIKDYLGIKVPDDTRGALQDVHWSEGFMGYFPSYTLGNLYSAQIYKKMREDIINLDRELSLGRLEHIREWLRKNIHIHGKMYSSDSLIRRLTRESLNSKYFTDYLEAKYKRIYDI